MHLRNASCYSFPQCSLSGKCSWTTLFITSVSEWWKNTRRHTSSSSSSKRDRLCPGKPDRQKKIEQAVSQQVLGTDTEPPSPHTHTKNTRLLAPSQSKWGSQTTVTTPHDVITLRTRTLTQSPRTNFLTPRNYPAHMKVYTKTTAQTSHVTLVLQRVTYHAYTHLHVFA